MKRIALTGGPSAGKSTAIRHLEADHSESMAFVPEAATLLLHGGFPAPTEEHPWSQDWQMNFQRAIAITQLALEQTITRRAQQKNQQIVLCDRGLVDGAAYLPGGIDELSKITRLRPRAMLGRYGLVIHLRSSAAQSIGYQKHSNSHRFEEAAKARDIETRTFEVWEKHPNRLILDIEDTATRNRTITKAVLDNV